MQRREASDYVPSDAIAWICISLGLYDDAMVWLE
jgi:hypothetical protein